MIPHRTWLLALLVAAGTSSAPALAQQKTVLFHGVQAGDQLGKLLFCMGHRHLWGPKGIVRKAVAMNPAQRVQRDGNLIHPKKDLRLPLPDGYDDEDIEESNVLSCARKPAQDDETPTVDASSPSEPEETDSVLDEPAAPAKNKSAPRKGVEPLALPTEAPEEEPSPASIVAAAAPPSPLPSMPTPAPQTEPAKAASPAGPRKLFGRIGGEGLWMPFSTTIPNGSRRYSLLGLGVTGGLDYRLNEKWSLAADARLVLLHFGSVVDGLRPMELRATGYYLLSESKRLRLVVSLPYLTMFGLNAGAGYRNLHGLEAGVEKSFSVFRGTLRPRLTFGVFNSDTALLTPGNFRFSLDTAYRPAEKPWNIGARLQWLQLGAFRIGNASFPSFSLFFEREL